MEPFAIVEVGGKQICVKPKAMIEVERTQVKDRERDFTFEKVLLAQVGKSLEVGRPYVKGASVICEYVGEVKGPKTLSFKLRRRKNSRKKIGHRQLFSQFRVKEIRYGS